MIFKLFHFTLFIILHCTCHTITIAMNMLNFSFYLNCEGYIYEAVVWASEGMVY